MRCAFFVHACGAAREDDAAGVHCAEFFHADGGGDKQREDAKFADSSSDELRGLAAEVENGNDFAVRLVWLMGLVVHGEGDARGRLVGRECERPAKSCGGGVSEMPRGIFHGMCGLEGSFVR